MLSAAVLLLIILPVALSLLLDIPAVQNYAVRRAAALVSQRLGTVVRVGRVDIGLFSKVRVEDFYVEDYGRDTLLYVGRLDAYVTGFGLWGGGVELSRGEIADARLHLHQMPDGEMNIKQIVARLSNPGRKRKGEFRLSLKSASIENMELCLDRNEERNPPYGIDFSHLHLTRLDARVDDFTIDGQAVYTTVASLSAREKSGFVLDHLSGRFYLTQGCLGFEQARIVTPGSDIRIPYVSLAGNSWADYRDFLGQVRIDAALRDTEVSTDDVAYFAPRLRDWHLTFSEIDARVAGVVSDFSGEIRRMRIGDSTTLAATASLRGLPDIRKTHFDLEIPDLRTSAAAADDLARRIAGKSLPASLAPVLDRAGDMRLNARFRGLLSSFDMRLGAGTARGDVTCDLRMSPLEKGRSAIRGEVSARDVRLGELTGHGELLGDATLSARIDGVVGRDYADARVEGCVGRFGFNGYVYDSLRLDGRLRNREFDGRITARDPNLDFDFFGLVDLNDSVPRYDFTMHLHHADLARLRINRRDSVSQLSARIVAKAGGRSLDDLNGRIRISDARYRYNDKEIQASNVTVTGENSDAGKFVELRSDFADVTFRSRTSYRTVFEYLRRSARRYLPVLRGGASDGETPGAVAAAPDDFSLLSVDIRNINPVADAVAAGLQIADGTSLRLLFNPASDRLSFKASSEYVERRRMLATRLSVNASNRGDSLTVYASAEDLYAGMLHLPHLSVTGGAKQGRVQLSTGFTDTVRKVSGLIGVRAGVLSEEGDFGRVIGLRILPSHITRGEKTWQIFAHRIRIDTAHVSIDRFFMMNDEQELLIDGVASRSRADSVTLSLRNFDLSTFTQVAERMGYAIEGRTNGAATMKSVLRGAEITADILFDSVRVNDIPAPPLRLASRWDFARNRAGVTVSDRLRRDTLVRGFYAPDRARYYARLTVDSLDMALLDPLLSGVISSTAGRASADLVLQGEGRKADLGGEVRVRNLRTTVDYTQVPYTMPEATVTVRNNRFRASGVPVFDAQGNRGRFDLDLDLTHLSNITFDVRVAPQRMLVLNTTEADNDTFYGRVHATGDARITGRKGVVNMDITASTDDDSDFFLPLSGKSNIANADFVVFERPERRDTLDAVARRKLTFERRHRQKQTAAGRMNVALALDVRPNADVELTLAGNTLKARGEGTLNLQIDPRSNIFEIYGDYTLTEGSFQLSLQNIISKRFTIENGSSIQWTGAPMDALLDIDAVYKLRASLQPLLQGTTDNLGGSRSVPVECVIPLGERLSNPSIGFDVRVPGSDPETQTVVANALSTPETVDTQFAYLLLFNSFMAESSSLASSNIGSSVSAATGMEFLSNMVSSWFSSLGYDFRIGYRPRSEQASDEVDFGISKSLINDRLFVEVEGNYLLDNKQAVNGSMSNFMGEAYITYLIDPAGTLKLKAFTQTIDRFDENQGLQETGIGIYFKEDFDNLRDLRQRIRARFTNRERRARRQARRAARAAERAAATSPDDDPRPEECDEPNPAEDGDFYSWLPAGRGGASETPCPPGGTDPAEAPAAFRLPAGAAASPDGGSPGSEAGQRPEANTACREPRRRSADDGRKVAN